MSHVRDNVLIYDETSPTFLRWSVDVYSGKGKIQVSSGTPAGTLNTLGGRGVLYYRTCYKRRTEANHRLVYILHFGLIPDGFVVDHIDGDTLNNRISNLRLITAKENNRNSRRYSNNSSGICGVSFKQTEDSYGFVGQVTRLDGKRSAKYFSIAKYGFMPAFTMACKCRDDMIKQLNAQGANYTERHGI